MPAGSRQGAVVKVVAVAVVAALALLARPVARDLLAGVGALAADALVVIIVPACAFFVFARPWRRRRAADAGDGSSAPMRRKPALPGLPPGGEAPVATDHSRRVEAELADIKRRLGRK